jgi:hypothetical protein
LSQSAIQFKISSNIFHSSRCQLIAFRLPCPFPSQEASPQSLVSVTLVKHGVQNDWFRMSGTRFDFKVEKRLVKVFQNFHPNGLRFI